MKEKKHLKIKKGDVILMLAGRNRGKKGKVLKAFPAKGMLVAEGIKVAKRHQRPSRNFQGGIIERPMPFPASQAMLVCPRCSKPTRVGSREVDGKKVRACKKCSEIIDKV